MAIFTTSHPCMVVWPLRTLPTITHNTTERETLRSTKQLFVYAFIHIFIFFPTLSNSILQWIPSADHKTETNPRRSPANPDPPPTTTPWIRLHCSSAPSQPASTEATTPPPAQCSAPPPRASPASTPPHAARSCSATSSATASPASSTSGWTTGAGGAPAGSSSTMACSPTTRSTAPTSSSSITTSRTAPWSSARSPSAASTATATAPPAAANPWAKYILWLVLSLSLSLSNPNNQVTLWVTIG